LERQRQGRGKTKDEAGVVPSPLQQGYLLMNGKKLLERVGAAATKINGERGWIRTSDPRLKRALLYQLSYAPTPN
jgi:hypothetical protein